MSSFKDIVNNFYSAEDVDAYLDSTFTKEYFKDYEIDSDADKLQRKAIETMFTYRKDIPHRIEGALMFDPYCIEAFFAVLAIADEVEMQLRFNMFYNEYNDFPNFDSYKKKCFLIIMDFYVEFLLNINNIATAIKVQKLIMKLGNDHSYKVISRLAFMYFVIEDYESLYRLYAENEFTLYEYIYLLITLLKYDEQLKAKEVLLDMYDNIEYGTYLDHDKDLDQNDPKQKEVFDIIERCFSEIKAIPTFFLWVKEIREKNGK